MASNPKRLRGVHATDSLQKLLQLAVVHTAAATNDDLEDATFLNARSDAVRQACRPVSRVQAATELKGFKLEGNCIPLPVIRAMAAFLVDGDSVALQHALTSTRLVFAPPPPTLDDNFLDNNGDVDGNLTKDQRRFRQRMQRLRFKEEETKYSKLTNNLGLNVKQDDVTTKSMTYAASIGLNMIVAPITFGVFMYFFAGSLLDFFWPKTETIKPGLENAPDIKKVIAGVVSGVAMLFIEMILFVIRTHEMDEAMRKKKKKSKKNPSPFGHYSSATEKTYHAVDCRNN